MKAFGMLRGLVISDSSPSYGDISGDIE